MQLLESDLITAAGNSKEELWNSLSEGKDHSQSAAQTRWGNKLANDGRVCLISDEREFSNRFKKYFSSLWQQVLQRLKVNDLAKLEKSRIGVIFSSTKGMHEDYIFQNQFDLNQDPYDLILQEFIQNSLQLPVHRSMCISHACASTHVSLEQAHFWLKHDLCDHVILLAGDLIGGFVFQGFQSLKIVSSTKSRPFAKDRDGLQLGEACGILLLSQQPENARGIERGIFVTSVKTDSEGVSVTRPSMDGSSLSRAIKKLESQKNPIDLIIAHGTATKFNDFSEDQAFSKLASRAAITGCKWSIGHTLGASGAVDLIAASLVLQRQKAFLLKNSIDPDPELKANYLFSGRDLPTLPIRKILLTSLGFGGIHGALSLEAH